MDKEVSTWENAKTNANPDCPKCKGTGSYMYDHNHGTICDLCCQHNMGFWLLEKHYGPKNGHWCCLAGCGLTVPGGDTSGAFCPSCKTNTIGLELCGPSNPKKFCNCCKQCAANCTKYNKKNYITGEK